MGAFRGILGVQGASSKVVWGVSEASWGPCWRSWEAPGGSWEPSGGPKSAQNHPRSPSGAQFAPRRPALLRPEKKTADFGIPKRLQNRPEILPDASQEAPEGFQRPKIAFRDTTCCKSVYWTRLLSISYPFLADLKKKLIPKCKTNPLRIDPNSFKTKSKPQSLKM